MEIRRILLVVFTSLLFFGCGSAKKTQVANQTLDTMMEQKAFKIKVRVAEPQVTTALAQIGASGLMRPGNTISRIDVTGEGYFIKLNGENVAANLPYFGERQMGGGYGSDTGIKFNQTARDLSIVKDAEKHSYVVSFSVDNSTESYFFTIDLGTNLNSTVWVRSSHRNRIRYTGNVIELEDDELVAY